MGVELSSKDRQFADRYFGGPDRMRGSAKACYKYLHPRCKDSTAETEGPSVLRKPQVQTYLEQQGNKVAERTEINAKWVLEESLRLYRMAIGEIPTIQERIVEKQDENGNTFYETEYYELCKTDLSAALRALWLIGKHAAVQAFTQKIDVSHNHRLEVALANRAKQVEEAAKRKLELVHSHKQ
jgi:homoserine acetyltransferase